MQHNQLSPVLSILDKQYTTANMQPTAHVKQPPVSNFWGALASKCVLAVPAREATPGPYVATASVSACMHCQALQDTITVLATLDNKNSHSLQRMFVYVRLNSNIAGCMSDANIADIANVSNGNLC